jgi:Ca2+-binding RTX toxin-like protein
MRHSRILVIGGALGILAAWFPMLPASGVVYCDGQIATIVGTQGDDVIFGTSNSDVIAGLGGDDQLFAGPESDVWYNDVTANSVCGGSGKDRIFGSSGRDRLLGGLGNDNIVGAPGYDVLLGGPGIDYLEDDHRGSEGVDIGYGAFIRGGDGPDRILKGPGVTKIIAGDGNDRIRAYGVGSGSIDAGRGDDIVDTVDLNIGTFGDCGEPVEGGGYENCPLFPDEVLGDGGTDTLIHDGDHYAGFENVSECEFDPDNPCSQADVP